MMYRFVFLILISLIATGRSFGQCLAKDNVHLKYFSLIIRTDSGSHSDDLRIDTASKWKDNYVGDQKKFFDSLGVITLDSALTIGCRKRNFVAWKAYLAMNYKTGMATWMLAGEEHYVSHFHWWRNKNEYEYQLKIDARSGKIISLKKKRYLVIHEF